MTTNKDHADSKIGSAHGRAPSHPSDAVAGLLRSHSSASAPHIGDALVLSGLSGIAALDGLSFVAGAPENIPAAPNDLNQAKLGLRILASAGEEPVPVFAESGHLAKLALEIVETADLARYNRDKVRPVAFRVYDLIRMLVEVSKLGNIEEVETYTVNLGRDLTKILDVVKYVVSDKTIVHLVHSRSTVHQLADCDMILDRYVDKIKASITVQNQQMLSHQEAKLAALTIGTANASESPKDHVTFFSSKSLASLPHPPIPFVGRDDLVQEGAEHISQTEAARLIILGLGGMGKTSLALAIAHHDTMKEIFGDKLYLVSCEGFKTGLDLVLAVIQVLGCSIIPDDDHDILSILSQQLLYAGKILLIVDNFETLWLESTLLVEVQRVFDLIASMQSVSLIVTMRGDIPPYNTSWTLILPHQGLGPLTLDAAREMYYKGNNFIQSTSQSEHDLNQLLLETNCIPLVISLLSVLGNQYSCTELYKKWCNIRTELLQIPEAKKSKSTSIAISIELSLQIPGITKSVDAIRLLSIIAFLPEGIPHWDTMLEHLVPDIDDPYEAIDIICRAALIYKSPQNSLTMLSPTRFYIRAQNKFNTKQHKQDLIFICQFVTSCMFNESKQITLLGKSNIAKILLNFMSFEPSYENAKTIYQCSEYLLESKMNMSSLIEILIPEIEKLNAPQLLAEYFLHLYDLFMELNSWEKAGQQSIKAYKIYTELTDQAGIAKSLQSLGHVHKMQSNYTEAIKNHTDACEIYSALNDNLGLANAFKALGSNLRSQGQFSDASEKLNQAYNMYKILNNTKGMAIALKGIGNNLRSQHQYTEAINAHQTAYDMFVDIQYKIGIADSLICLGDDLYSLGQYNAAIQKHNAALQLYNKLDNDLGIAASLDSLGDDLRMQCKYFEAAIKHNKAFAIFSKFQYLHGMGNCLSSMANNLKMQQKYIEANNKYQTAYQIFSQIGNRPKMAQIQKNMKDLVN